MKSILTLIVSSTLGLATAPAAQLILDFDDGLGNGIDVADFYLSQGVSFLNGEWSSLASGYVPHPESTGLRIVGDGANLQPKAANPIVILLSNPVTFVSVIANNVNANGAQIDAFSDAAGNNLVDSGQVIGSTGALNSNFVISAQGPSISRIELYQPRSVESEGVLFDNLTLNPVPEPSVLGLAGLALVGAAFRRNRKR